jgi:hypothetical protein
MLQQFLCCCWFLVEYDTNYCCSWQNDVFVVAEPGELADRFLQSVKTILSTLLRGCNRKGAYSLSKISCLSELVAEWPSFEIGGIHHRYIGRQTQVGIAFSGSSFPTKSLLCILILLP